MTSSLRTRSLPTSSSPIFSEPMRDLPTRSLRTARRPITSAPIASAPHATAPTASAPTAVAAILFRESIRLSSHFTIAHPPEAHDKASTLELNKRCHLSILGDVVRLVKGSAPSLDHVLELPDVARPCGRPERVHRWISGVSPASVPHRGEPGHMPSIWTARG